MSGPDCTGDGVGEVCITCSDLAVPVLVLEVRPDDLALVRTAAGVDEEVSVALVEAGVGDTVLVHAGEALARMDPAQTGPARVGPTTEPE